MKPSKELEPWRKYDRLSPALLTGLLLGTATYVMDFLLQRLGTGASAAILSAVGVGILGGASVYFYLTASRAKYNYENAKERLTLIGDLNERIRQALVSFAATALSDDRTARLRGIDEATDRIDGILTDFLTPTNGKAKQQVLPLHTEQSLQTEQRLEPQSISEER